MGCIDEKEVRKAVQFEYFIEMFGSCDKESLTKLFAALLVKLNDNGVMFNFPDIKTKDCYVPISDRNGVFRDRLNFPMADMVFMEEIKLDFLHHDVEVLQKIQGKV